MLSLLFLHCGCTGQIISFICEMQVTKFSQLTTKFVPFRLTNTSDSSMQVLSCTLLPGVKKTHCPFFRFAPLHTELWIEVAHSL